jgi:hypothetical protein
MCQVRENLSVQGTSEYARTNFLYYSPLHLLSYGIKLIILIFQPSHILSITEELSNPIHNVASYVVSFM